MKKNKCFQYIFYLIQLWQTIQTNMSRESMYVTDKIEFDAIDPDKVDSLLGNGILHITPVSNLLNHCEQHIHNNNKHLLHHTRNQHHTFVTTLTQCVSVVISLNSRYIDQQTSLLPDLGCRCCITHSRKILYLQEFVRNT